MFTRHISENMVYYTSPLLDSHHIPHGFFTRYGGVSTGDFSSLNISAARKDSLGKTDSPQHIAENYRRALAIFGENRTFITARQIHSAVIVEATADMAHIGFDGVSRHAAGFDGAAARAYGDIDGVCIKTADCVPILLANTVTGDVCGLHAGWRGSAMGIAAKGAKRLASGNPAHIIAAVGPCIGKCCYPVGKSVIAAFEAVYAAYGAALPPNAATNEEPPRIDLAALNGGLLEAVGVPRKNIDISGICTCCFADEHGHPFFSHRRMAGHSGTFLSVIARPL